MTAAEPVERVATVTALPQRVQDTVPAVVEQVETPEQTEVEDLGPSLWSRFLEYWQPPDIWSDDQPSLRKEWLYAKYGKWTSKTGALRVAGCVDAYVVIALFAVIDTLKWIVKRPGRRFIAAIVVALVILIVKGH